MTEVLTEVAVKRVCLLEYDAMYSGENQMLFQRNISPTFSESKSGLKNKPA
jgi:hypothetical protein